MTRIGKFCCRRLLPALVGVLGAVVLVEGSLRLVTAAPRTLEREGALFGKTPVRRLPYVNKPDASLTLTYRDRHGGRFDETRMEVNANGLRGPLVDIDKPEGVLRIACLGDSFTFGYGVAEGETWPAHLQDLLGERAGGRRVEVLNCGVNGYHTADERRYLEHHVWKFEPDIVVMQFFLNDVSHRGLENDVPVEPVKKEAPALSWLYPWVRPEGHLEGLRGVSYLVDHLCEQLYGLQGIESLGVGISLEEDDPAWKRVRMSLHSSQSFVEDRGGRFLVALYPHLFDVGGGRFASDEHYAEIAAYAREAGLEVVDASSAMRGRPTGELRNSEIDFHGNSRAHRLFAEVVLAEIDRKGWLSGRATESSSAR